MEVNVGAGFENAIASGDADDNATCSGFTALFGADPEQTAKLLDTGALDFALHTLYRPANLVEGETYPIITWGNGTCAAPEGYGALLRYVASHGFFVIAPNSRWVGSGEAQRKGIDYMLAANADSASPFYQKLDPERIGAMGHSQGGSGTQMASSDSRIKAAILWNGGSSASGKPFLLVTGDRDIGDPNVSGVQSTVQGATKAAYLFYHMIPMEGSAPG
ncbi:MAG TPA: alpha/beta fold hydrolase, partial [Polyangiales bacterium]|nr:alpha/beta fold hydrolase [Polyangiales bacterium]